MERGRIHFPSPGIQIAQCRQHLQTLEPNGCYLYTWISRVFFWGGEQESRPSTILAGYPVGINAEQDFILLFGRVSSKELNLSWCTHHKALLIWILQKLCGGSPNLNFIVLLKRNRPCPKVTKP